MIYTLSAPFVLLMVLVYKIIQKATDGLHWEKSKLIFLCVE